MAQHFEQRRIERAVRECHGDLHLGNMLLGEGRIRVFDCLEFSEALRWIDVISDMAFLAMDLRQRGRADLAGVVLDRWLQKTGDYAGLRAWRWYRVYRALVRVKVAALRLSQSREDSVAEANHRELWRYLEEARSVAAAPAGQLVLCHGVSGSGKTQLAQRLCRQLGWIRLCSDIERRRLFGRWGALLASQPLSGDPYRPEVSERLYGDVLLSAAEQALLAGENMIVDATFLRRSQRHRFQQLARRCGVRCRILDCRVSEAVAASRIERRQRQGTDPSEANLTVLRAQWDQREPLEAEELEVSLVVDLDGGLEQQTWTWLLTQLGGFGAAATRLIDPDLT